MNLSIYLTICLSLGVGAEGSSIPVKSQQSSAKKAPRFSKSDHEALAEIFKKIGQKDLSKVVKIQRFKKSVSQNSKGMWASYFKFSSFFLS